MGLLLHHHGHQIVVCGYIVACCGSVLTDCLWFSGFIKEIQGETGTVDLEKKPSLRDVWRSDNGKDWTLVTDSAPWAPRGMITGANGGVRIPANMHVTHRDLCVKNRLN